MSLATTPATLSTLMPRWWAGPEKPYPGIDGKTRWNASSALPPWPTGSVSGPITSMNSYTDPGQP